MNKQKKGKGRKRKLSRLRNTKNKRTVTLSKTKEMGQAIETDHLSELTEEESEVNFRRESNLKGFALFDAKYLMPFFTRRFTDQEVKDCRSQMTDLTNRWYQTVRRPSDSDDDEQDGLCDSESVDEEVFNRYHRDDYIVTGDESNDADYENDHHDDDDEYDNDGDDEGRQIIFKRSNRRSNRKLNASRSYSSDLDRSLQPSSHVATTNLRDQLFNNDFCNYETSTSSLGLIPDSSDAPASMSVTNVNHEISRQSNLKHAYSSSNKSGKKLFNLKKSRPNSKSSILVNIDSTPNKELNPDIPHEFRG